MPLLMVLMAKSMSLWNWSGLLDRPGRPKSTLQEYGSTVEDETASGTSVLSGL